MIAPALRRAMTTATSSAVLEPTKAHELGVDCIEYRVTMLSLSKIGTPCTGLEIECQFVVFDQRTLADQRLASRHPDAEQYSGVWVRLNHCTEDVVSFFNTRQICC